MTSEFEVGSCPKKLIPMPGFPALRIECFGWDENGIINVYYTGNAEDLLASGAAEPEMLKAGRNGQQRQDRDGDYYYRRKYRVGTESQRRDQFKLLRKKHAAKLPGSAEAIAAFRAHQDWFDYLHREAHAIRSGLPLRPFLRLVVDNTRPETRS